jgi:hypothetical protein
MTFFSILTKSLQFIDFRSKFKTNDVTILVRVHKTHVVYTIFHPNLYSLKYKILNFNSTAVDPCEKYGYNIVRYCDIISFII